MENGRYPLFLHFGSMLKAGFPRVPGNLKPANPHQPYSDYDLAKLESFLKGFQLPLEPDTKSDYSNFEAGLGGYGLERLHKKTLEQLFRDALLDKLYLNNTRVMLPPEQTSRLTPVLLSGDPAEPWQRQDKSVLQGAGALRSTMQDMMTLLKTMMDLMVQDHMPMIATATKPTFDKGKGIPSAVLSETLKERLSFGKVEGNRFGVMSAREKIIRRKGDLLIESKEKYGTKVTLKLAII